MIRTFVWPALGAVLGMAVADPAFAHLPLHTQGTRPPVIHAIDTSQKKRGYGGVLMRFADTLARQGNCRTVILNAIDSEVGFYEKLEYKKVASAAPIPLDDETYWPMQRSVLYHQRPK